MLVSLLLTGLAVTGVDPAPPAESLAFVAVGTAGEPSPLRLLAVDPGPPVRVFAATARTVVGLRPGGRLDPVPLPAVTRDEDPADDPGPAGRSLGLVRARADEEASGATAPAPRIRALLAARRRLVVGLPAGLAVIAPEGPGRPAGRWERLDGRPVDVLAAAGRQWLAAQGAWIWRSSDHGRTWARLGRVPAAAIHGLAAAGPGLRELIVLHDRGVLRSGDGGRTFRPAAWDAAWGRPLHVARTVRGGRAACLVLGERWLVRISPGSPPQPLARVDPARAVAGAAGPGGADWVLDDDLRRALGRPGRFVALDRGLGSDAALAVVPDPAREWGAYVAAGAVIYRLMPAPPPRPVACAGARGGPFARLPRTRAFLRRGLLPRMTLQITGAADPGDGSSLRSSVRPAWRRRGVTRDVAVVLGLSWSLGQARGGADLLSEQAAALADARARVARRGRALRAACRAAGDRQSPESPGWTDLETQRALRRAGPRVEEDP